MTKRLDCPECGRPLPEGALGGVCPVCSLQSALKLAPAEALPVQAPLPSEVDQPSILNAQTATRFGDYELVELVARGGMGVVYKARQISLNRTVALKMIQAGILASPTEVQRFQAEAEAIAHLQHPNIVAIHDIGEQDGRQYFSMDYVAGRTLAELVREGPLPATRAACYVKIIAGAVHYAHQHGILHRDLKPANIIIDEHDQPQITDFGLAKRLDDYQLSALHHPLTLSGQVLGSPNYLPPEQAEAKRGALGPPSDVYALGAILYHLLTGRPPFQAESLTTLLRQVIETDPVTPGLLNLGIPHDLETVCLKCLEKEPRRRYATAQALADDLGRFLNREPVLARPIGGPGKASRWCRRQPVRAGLTAALIVVFAGGTAGVLWQWRQAQANAAAELRQRRAAVAAGAEAEIREYSANISLAQSHIQAQQFNQALDILFTRTPESYRGWEWGWLLRSCSQDLMTLSGNPSLGVEAVFSPDSRFLLTSGFDPVIRIWEFATGEAIGSLQGHTGVANMTSFGADGRRLCTFSWDAKDKTARVWDMETKRMLFQPLDHPDAVNYGVLSREGRRLATAGADGKVRVYDVTTGADTGLSNDYGDAIIAVAFSPDGRRIAYAGGVWTWSRSQDTSIRIWELATGKTQQLAGHSQAVFGLAWSPDGAMLVSCGFDGQIKAWDPDSGRELLPRFVASPKQKVLCRADFSPDGRLLGVVGGDDPHPTARATLFDVRTREVVRELAGHSTVVQSIRFSLDGKYIATSSLDRTVKIWPVAPLPAFVSLEGHSQAVWTAAFSPDGRRVATGSLDQTARIWNATNGVLLRTLRVRFPVVSLAFSHDGEKLATVGPDNSACVWKASTEPEARSHQPEEARIHEGVLGNPKPDADPSPRSAEDQEPFWLRGHTRAVLSVAWSPDDRWIATGSKDNSARIWDASTGREHLTLAGHTGLVEAVAFSPSGKVLATGSADGTARLWSTSSGQCLLVLTNHGGGVLSLAFSPNPKWHLVATGSGDGSARLWDSDTGRLIHRLSGHINGVSSVAFSPDGQRLVTTPGGTDLHATATRAISILLWDVTSGHQLLTLSPHNNAIYAAAFSPDGKGLVTAAGDNTARISTAFPWCSPDYAGDTNQTLPARVEQFKRDFWKMVVSNQRPADAPRRSWTNGFRLCHHLVGDMYLPPAGSKNQPLFPIPRRPAEAGPKQIDLSGTYNVALNETWQPIDNLTNLDLSLAALPPSLQSFGGVAFDVRGILQLRGGAPDCELHPDQVGFRVGRTFQRFHILHGTTGSERQGREIGAFVLHYANGEFAEISIRFGEHVRDQCAVGDTQMDCPNARLAWGANPSVDPDDGRPRLYQAMFLNPKPELEVASIEFVSKVTRCGPFLLAVTVE
jgi:WD40 repeat protein/tRNA A-37 threonylcarbamoyl transferase component Bud32